VGADDHSEAGADVGDDAQTADPVAEGSPVVDGQKQEQINPLLREMLDVIEKHYTDNTYSVERLADDMCMTKITLYRRVKTLSGQTPVELLNEFRLQKAMALLKEGNIQVGDVAFQVGFSAPAYFTRRFRHFFNFPPSAVKPYR
jgi:transcriptional regulator GlxA family with amidase domain